MMNFVERPFETMDLGASRYRKDEWESKLVGPYHKTHEFSEVPSSCQSHMPKPSIQCASFNLERIHQSIVDLAMCGVILPPCVQKDGSFDPLRVLQSNWNPSSHCEGLSAHAALLELY